LPSFSAHHLLVIFTEALVKVQYAYEIPLIRLARPSDLFVDFTEQAKVTNQVKRAFVLKHTAVLHGLVCHDLKSRLTRVFIEFHGAPVMILEDYGDTTLRGLSMQVCFDRRESSFKAGF
jgi:hypothetical protein